MRARVYAWLLSAALLGGCAPGTIGDGDDEDYDELAPESELTSASCPSFTSSNTAHVSAGRANVHKVPLFFFSYTTYLAAGTGESLGTSGSASSTLYQIGAGRYSRSATNCPASTPSDAGVDAQVPDASAASDASVRDAGSASDASVVRDAGTPDAAADAAAFDAGADAGAFDAGAVSDAGSLPVDAGPIAQPGHVGGRCSVPLPPEARAVDVSRPSRVVGSGTPASCSEAALRTAVAGGGIVTFNCGPTTASIPLSQTIELAVDRDLVLDGAGKVTLDGQHRVRVLSWNSANWQANTHTLTLQHLTIANGKASGTDLIPTRPAPCSQGYNDGEGGALFMRDGALRAIEVSFVDNQAAQLGPDTGGGALYLLGSKPAYVVRCRFSGNNASNAGAMGSLFTTDFVYDSLFENNAAVGSGANNDDASQCSYVNNGQHEIGSGGNGGAIYSDGVAMDVNLCGVEVRGSRAGAFGAAVFFTSNDAARKGTLTIRDSLMVDNVPANLYWEALPGVSTNGNIPAPINSDVRR